MYKFSGYLIIVFSSLLLITSLALIAENLVVSISGIVLGSLLIWLGFWMKKQTAEGLTTNFKDWEKNAKDWGNKPYTFGEESLIKEMHLLYSEDQKKAEEFVNKATIENKSLNKVTIENRFPGLRKAFEKRLEEEEREKEKRLEEEERERTAGPEERKEILKAKIEQARIDIEKFELSRKKPSWLQGKEAQRKEAREFFIAQKEKKRHLDSLLYEQEREERLEEIKIQEQQKQEERLKFVEDLKRDISDEKKLEKVSKAFLKGKHCEGMPRKYVEFNYGRIFDRKETVSKKGKTVKGKYIETGTNQRGNPTYKYEMTFEDSILTGWKEL